jgi:hypothetical protein
VKNTKVEISITAIAGRESTVKVFAQYNFWEYKNIHRPNAKGE